MDFNKFAFIDVETSGCSVGRDRVIEIGVVRVENNEVVAKFNSLVNPQTYVSPYIEYMTGIQKAELDKAPTFEDVKDEVYELLDDCIFVAHNARFDYGFMKEEFGRYNKQFSARCLCTVKLSRHLFPQFRNHSLDYIIQRFSLSCERRHRAYDDAHVLFQFYQQLLQQFPAEKVLDACKLICKRPSLPPHLSQKYLKVLPESPGVYIFYSKEKIPLYVGKSKNIKERVLSHFLNVYDSDKEMEMCQQVHDIEFRVTAGELGALLLESQLAKELQPYYNRSLKKKEELVVVQKNIDTDGYYIPEVTALAGIESANLSNILAIFKNKQKAKEYLQQLVNEYNLCGKLLGLEKTKNSCFAHKINICNGACLGKESPDLYNKRFLEAFQKKKIASWLYDGPIMIEERNTSGQITQGYIFDKWTHLATVSWTEDSSQVVQNSNNFFDLDVYHILRTYMNKPVNIKPLQYEKVEEIIKSHI